MRKRKTSWYPKRHVTIFCFCFFSVFFSCCFVVVVSILLLLFLRLRLLQPGQPLVHLKWQQYLNKILKFSKMKLYFFFSAYYNKYSLFESINNMHINPEFFWHLLAHFCKKISTRIRDESVTQWNESANPDQYQNVSEHSLYGAGRIISGSTSLTIPAGADNSQSGLRFMFIHLREEFVRTAHWAQRGRAGKGPHQERGVVELWLE